MQGSVFCAYFIIDFDSHEKSLIHFVEKTETK